MTMEWAIEWEGQIMGSASPFSRGFIYFGKGLHSFLWAEKQAQEKRTFWGGRSRTFFGGGRSRTFFESGRSRTFFGWTSSSFLHFSSLCWGKAVEWDTHLDIVGELVTRKLSLNWAKVETSSELALPTPHSQKGNVADSSITCREKKGHVEPVWGVGSKRD